jgi:hypothetical protein
MNEPSLSPTGDDNYQSLVSVSKSFMTNDEIETRLHSFVSDERKLTAEILDLINQADQRKIYLTRGYGSLFDWLTQSYNYSEAAAQRRIQAARLLRSVPDISRKVSTGEVNLTTLAKAQSAIRYQEKTSGLLLTHAAKAQVIEKIENKSGRETERALLGLFPNLALRADFERRTVLNESVSKLSLSLSGEALKDLERVKELLSHALPEANFAQVIAYLAKNFLKKKDPLASVDKNEKKKVSVTRPTESSAAAKPCVKVSKTKESIDVPLISHVSVKTLSQSLRREILRKAGGRCSYKDLKTGRVCGSTYQIEVDHIWPKALGGGNEESNLRCLCRKHNQLMAEQALGHQLNRYRIDSSSKDP